MKIVNIVPGFGGTFYCGNCLRDSVLVESMKAIGHEAITLPVYLPLTLDYDPNETEMPVFYGAVNIYLKQNFRLLRKMPPWMERVFNSKPVLKFAARKAGSTRAKGLEEMTISMLKGPDGYQKQELQQLIDYLKNYEKPDLVHLSNALLTGLARKIKEELKIPIVCTLQDEDTWVDVMEENQRGQIWDLMHGNSLYVDRYIAVSQYFADVMQAKMSIRQNKLNVVHLGVDPTRYVVHDPGAGIPTLGFLSRMNKNNGLEVLMDAYIILKRKPQFNHIKLVII